MGKYVTKNHCVKCDVALTRSEEMHSNGTCPYCGNTTNSTIVDTKKVLYYMKFLPRQPESIWNTICDYFSPKYKLISK